MPATQLAELETSPTVSEEPSWIPQVLRERQETGLEALLAPPLPLPRLDRPMVEQKDLTEIGKPYPEAKRQALLRLHAAKGALNEPLWSGVKAMLGDVIPLEEKKNDQTRGRLARQISHLFVDLVTNPIANRNKGGLGDYLPAELNQKQYDQLEETLVEAQSVGEDSFLSPSDPKSSYYSQYLRRTAEKMTENLRIFYGHTALVRCEAQPNEETTREVLTHSLWGKEVFVQEEVGKLERLLEALETNILDPASIRDALLSLPFQPSERKKIVANLPPGILESLNDDTQLTEEQRKGLMAFVPLLRAQHCLFDNGFATIENVSSREQPKLYKVYLSGRVMSSLLRRQERRLSDNGGNEVQLGALKRFKKKVDALTEQFKAILQPEIDEEEQSSNLSQNFTLNLAVLRDMMSQPLGTNPDGSYTEITEFAGIAYPTAIGEKMIRLEIEEGKPTLVKSVQSAEFLNQNRQPGEWAITALERLQDVTLSILLTRELEIPLEKTPEAMRRTLAILGCRFDLDVYEKSVQEKLMASLPKTENERDTIPIGVILNQALSIAKAQGALEPYENSYTPDPEAAALACGFAAQCLAVFKSFPPARQEMERVFAGVFMQRSSLRELALIAEVAHRHKLSTVSLFDDLKEDHFHFAKEALQKRTIPSFEEMNERFADRFPDEESFFDILKYLYVAAGNVEQSCGLKQLDPKIRREGAPMAIISGGPGGGKSTILEEIWHALVEDGIVVNFGAGGVTKAGYITSKGYITDVYNYIWIASAQALEARIGGPPTPNAVKQYIESGKVIGMLDEIGKVLIDDPEKESRGQFGVAGEGAQHEILDNMSEGGTFKINFVEPVTQARKEILIQTGCIPLALADTWEKSEKAMRAREKKKAEENGDISKIKRELSGYVKLPSDLNLAEMQRKTGLSMQLLRRIEYGITMKQPTSEMVLRVLNTPHHPDSPDYNRLNPLSRASAKIARIQAKLGDSRPVDFSHEAINEIARRSRPNLQAIGWSAPHRLATALVHHLVAVLNPKNKTKEKREGLIPDGKGGLIITKKFVSAAIRAKIKPG